MKARRLGYGAAAAGVGIASYGAWSAVAWTRYGHTHPERYPRDELLDQFIPNPEVDEYHQLTVNAPAPLTFAVAKAMDLQASPIIKAIFWLRAVPAVLRGQPFAAKAPGASSRRRWGSASASWPRCRTGRSWSAPTPSPGAGK
jgi:hypothetical protein